MKKKKHLFFLMLLLIMALLTGCQSSMGQDISEEDTSMEDIFIETQIEELQTETETQKETELWTEAELQTESELQEKSEQQTEKEVQTETKTLNDTSLDSETLTEHTASTEILESEQEEMELDEDGSYTSKEEVAAYINQYEKLPSNFITKKEAKKLGWASQEGNLGEVAPGKSIGGDYFGNYEGLLPEEEDRDYYECDINSNGGYRGAERIVFSNDGLIYYTGDHYETFELLYGEE